MMIMLMMMMMLMIMLMFADLDGCQATPPCSQTLASNLVCQPGNGTLRTSNNSNHFDMAVAWQSSFS